MTYVRFYNVLLWLIIWECSSSKKAKTMTYSVSFSFPLIL